MSRVFKIDYNGEKSKIINLDYVLAADLDGKDIIISMTTKDIYIKFDKLIDAQKTFKILENQLNQKKN